MNDRLRQGGADQSREGVECSLGELRSFYSIGASGHLRQRVIKLLVHAAVSSHATPCATPSCVGALPSMQPMHGLVSADWAKLGSKFGTGARAQALARQGGSHAFKKRWSGRSPLTRPLARCRVGPGKSPLDCFSLSRVAQNPGAGRHVARWLAARRLQVA
jgi:hypothetical protein